MKKLITAFLFIMSFQCALSENDPWKSAILQEEANTALNQGNYEEAAKKYMDSLACYSDNKELLAFLNDIQFNYYEFQQYLLDQRYKRENLEKDLTVKLENLVKNV